MGFHLAAYTFASTGGLSLKDMTALVDPAFSQRNGHYIFSEPYQLLAGYAIGKTITDVRLNMPSVNAVAYQHVQLVNQSIKPPSPDVMEDYRSNPLQIPQYEEMAWLVSDGGSAAEQESLLMFISPPGWNRNVPQGQSRLTVKATATPNVGAYAWGQQSIITFETTLKGGWYSVVGCECLDTSLLAIQLNFPRMPLFNGRKLFPGTRCIQTPGAWPLFYDRGWVGWWGTFHSFELPQMLAMGYAAGTGSSTLFFDLVYHGGTPPPNLVSNASYGA